MHIRFSLGLFDLAKQTHLNTGLEFVWHQSLLVQSRRYLPKEEKFSVRKKLITERSLSSKVNVSSIVECLRPNIISLNWLSLPPAPI